MTPEESARLDELEAKYGNQQYAGDSGLQRLGRSLLNIPSYVQKGILNTAIGVADLLPGPALPRVQDSDVPYSAFDLPVPRTTGQFVGELPARLGSELIQLAGPGEIVKAGLLAKGAPKLLATAGAGIAQGAQSGIRESAPESGIQAGEFAAGNAIAESLPGPGWLKVAGRAAAQLAVPFAGQGLRAAETGIYDAKAAALQGLTQAALGSGLGRQIGRDFMLRKSGQMHSEPIGPANEVIESQTYAELAQPRAVEQPRITPPKAEQSSLPNESDLWKQTWGEPLEPATAAKSQPAVEQQRAAVPAQRTQVGFLTKDQLLRRRGMTPFEASIPDDLAQAAQPNEYDAFGGRVRRPDKESPFPPAIEGATYQGQSQGQHNFRDEQTGGNFVVEGPATPEAIITKRDMVRERFQGEQAGEGDIDRILAEQAPEAQTAKLDNLMSLLKKPTESPQADPAVSALRRNRDALQVDYDAARATGDEDAAEEALASIKFIDSKLGAEAPKKLKLRSRESGAVPLPVLSGIAGGVIGATQGDTTEDRIKNAAIGAALGAGLPKGLSLLRKDRVVQSQRKQAELMRNPSATKLQQGVSKALTKFNAGKSTELSNATERVKSQQERYISPVSRSAAKVSEAERAAVEANPGFVSAIEEFSSKSGASLDTTKLEAAGVPKATIAMLSKAKEAKIALQQEHISAMAESPLPPTGILPGDWERLPANVKRAIVTRDTLGTYQSRVYGIDADPASWKQDDVAFADTVKWLKERNPAATDAELTEALNRELVSRKNGQGSTFGSSGSRVSESLYMHRKDLSDREWAMLGALATNPAVPAPLQAILQKASGTQQLTTAEQKAVALLSANPLLTDADRGFAKSVGERTILPESYRKLLGEVTSPIQKELMTIAKLAKSGGSAKFINEISSYGPRAETGLKPVLSNEEWLAAKAAGSNVTEYVKLEPKVGEEASVNLGKLRDKWVTPDVYRHLMDPPAQPPSALMKYGFHVPTSIAKQAVTVMNPATHGRQILQTPIMMLAGRVSPATMVKTIKRLPELLDKGSALRQQIAEDHVLHANFSAQELGSSAIDFLKKNGLLRKGASLAMSPVKLARAMYGAPDDLVRIVSYLGALERFKGDRFKAMEFLNRFTMNYGQVPEAIGSLRKLPFGGPFLSWSSEMVRVSKNLAQEMLHGSSYKDRVWAASALGALYGIGVGASSYAKGKLSKSERDEFEKSEKLMPTYLRYQAKVPLGKNKAGGRDFVSTGALTPGGDLVSLANSLLKGDFEAALQQNAFVGLHSNPVVSAAVDIAQGRHHFTQNKLETPQEKLNRGLEAISPPLLPTGYEGRKLKKLINRGEYADSRTGQVDTVKRAVARNLGLNIQSASAPVLLRNAKAKVDSDLREAQADFRREIKSGAPEKIARDQLLRRQQAIREEFQGLTK